MRKSPKFSPQVVERAVRMVFDAKDQYPSQWAAIESIAQGGSSFVVVLRLVGENEEVQFQTRWKDRDGKPTLVEASHLSRIEVAAEAAETDHADLLALGDAPVAHG